MIPIGTFLVGAGLSLLAVMVFDRPEVEEIPTNVDEVIENYEREMRNGN